MLLAESTGWGPGWKETHRPALLGPRELEGGSLDGANCLAIGGSLIALVHLRVGRKDIVSLTEPKEGDGCFQLPGDCKEQ